MIKVFSTPNCVYCTKAVTLLKAHGLDFEMFNLYENAENMESFRRYAPGATTVPQIVINESLVGGFDELSAVISTPNFTKLMESKNG
tara:strand:- start:16034 stop:16294 length:261 start_codon:yes stop_codon:yes gene_type:complete